MKKGKIRQCGYCGNDVYIKPCKLIYKVSFCSREHHTKYQKEKAFNFPCKVCETPIYTQPSQLKLRARSTCSPQCRRKLRRTEAEERRIKFGYTKHQLDRLSRNSPEMKEWRKAVFERDDYTCQFCGVRGTYLEADHIKPFAYFYDLRYILTNGRTLCRPCHDKTKISAKAMREIYA